MGSRQAMTCSGSRQIFRMLVLRDLIVDIEIFCYLTRWLQMAIFAGKVPSFRVAHGDYSRYPQLSVLYLNSNTINSTYRLTVFWQKNTGRGKQNDVIVKLLSLTPSVPASPMYYLKYLPPICDILSKYFEKCSSMVPYNSIHSMQ